MTTSPTLTSHYLAESDPRQHAFPHSPNTSDNGTGDHGFFVIVAMTLQLLGKKNLRAKGRARHFAIITFHRVQGSALPKEAWNPLRVPHSIKWITRRPITHQHDYAKSSCGDNRCHPAMP